MKPIKLTEEQIARFTSNLRRDPKTGCLLFTGYCAKKTGYGQFSVNRTPLYAHRIAWIIAGNKITRNKPHVLHSCDNPPCCEPSHLFAGNDFDNRRDMAMKERGTGKGVTQLPGGRWRARVTILHRNYHIGVFDTPEQALAAVRREKKRIYGIL